MPTSSIGAASYPMPRHQLPPAVQQHTQHFGAQLQQQLHADGVPRSGLSPSASIGAGKNMAGVTAQQLLNSAGQ